MNADKASILYYAIKTHYTSKQYNAVTYNFHVRVKQIPANQYYVFDKLARKYKNELKYFYIRPSGSYGVRCWCDAQAD